MSTQPTSTQPSLNLDLDDLPAPVRPHSRPSSRLTPPNSSSSRLDADSASSSPTPPHGTPRRLPQASPPCARLRLIAPAPVKIPPTPPFNPAGRAGTYSRHTHSTKPNTAAGSPTKRQRVAGAGSGAGAGAGAKAGETELFRAVSVGLGMIVAADAGLNDGEMTAEMSDTDPFDLEYAFASPPVASPTPYTLGFSSCPAPALTPVSIPIPIVLGSKQRTSSPLDIPTSNIRPLAHRQSSCATDRTESTQPSFSTSPVYLAGPKPAPAPKLKASASASASDRASLPLGNGRGRTRSSRTVPDVPDEILDELSDSRHSAQWSDEDARAPTRRTGDELLSPGAFLAAHVPRPVLVQFRDVFGANDTFAPHLPASIYPSSPAHSHSPARAVNNPSPGSTRRPSPHAPRSPAPAPAPSLPNPSPRSPPVQQCQGQGRLGPSPGGVSIAESFATFGVHRSDKTTTTTSRREREESGASDADSFTFSAYHLADDDPVREIQQLQLPPSPIKMGRTQSARPVSRSVVPLHSATPRSARPVRPPRPSQAGVAAPADAQALLRPFMGLEDAAADARADYRTRAEQPGWVHPFARSATHSPGSGSSDEGGEDELVTPEQQPGGAPLSLVGQGHKEEDFGTPTPTPRVRDVMVPNAGLGLGLGLGLKLPLAESTYRQHQHQPHSAGSDLHQPMHNSSGARTAADTRPTPARVPKMMQVDYELALAAAPSTSTDSLPPPLPLSKSVGPKKFKSLASLRKRLPSSRGAAPPPPPPVPVVPSLTDSQSATSLHSLPSAEFASLTGKPTPSRPTTAQRQPASQARPAFGEIRGDTPPPTGSSAAFSINSGSGLLGSSGQAPVVAGKALPDVGIKRAENGWTGGLKKDLVVEGMTVRRDMTLNLWVDQENCREVISTLHPIRYHQPDSTRTRALERIADILREKETMDHLEEVMNDSKDEGDVFWDEGCVEFGMNPRKRDQWAFTYGALESFPSLRRVTMEGKQNYDFTSRIASLKHREPGIYAVHGEEKGGARWRFRYMVYIPPAAKDPGDRVIVPMSFYATIAFLRGDHASKLGFGNMIGKALRSNLHSEKMATPELSSSAHESADYTFPARAHERLQSAASAKSNISDVSIQHKLIEVQVKVETFVDGGVTPRAVPKREYRPNTAESGGGGGRGEMRPLLPKMATEPGSARSPRPSTAQEPRRVMPLTSLGSPSNIGAARDANSVQTRPPLRVRPGTAAPAFPATSPGKGEKVRVAPFLSNEPPTPSTLLPPPSAPPAHPGRLSSAFGRARALTSVGSRPHTPLSAPLPAVPELPPQPLSATATAFASGIMRAKKSLSSLRPPSRPGTAGLPISRPLEPPLPTSASAGALDIPSSGRLRTKSSNYALPSRGGRPSTAAAAVPNTAASNGPAVPPKDGSHSASLFSSFPFSRSSRPSRPSTANPTSSSASVVPHTPVRPPTAPSSGVQALKYGFGSYVDTPPNNGVTYSALAMQQLEAKRTPGTFMREAFGKDYVPVGKGTGFGLGPKHFESRQMDLRMDKGRKGEMRRPRTATADGRAKGAGSMI
ncbi:uncharacterized protein MKK02DRAFT_41753 [Dioszegia hungarica]|uniref:Uncharacterized protein n=1 Tax=Dioszegia hungarica TaxID=4972 RepID=A0AA38LYC1_9TREE|nr:uncharacterized protein MKK02DRAFT_41753 [Dioszegia hungarica]KAI9638731.1 hypothetical protein MKK02DRAFT_41753 [Dioszegia hungarica]